MNINSLAYIGGKLYFSYGESGEEFTYKTFFTADIDGSNRKEFAKVSAENIDNTVYTDSSVIVSYSDTLDLTDENATALKERSEWESGIYIINLSDGNSQQICTHTGNSGKISKMSSDGKSIYYLFEYTDGTANRSELYKYDTENQNEELLKSFENCYFNGGFSDTAVMYTQKTDNATELHSYSFDGEDTLIAREESLSNYFYYDEKRVVYGIYETESQHYCLYDLQTGETEIVGDTASEIPIIYAVTDGKIYISTADNSGNSYGIGCLSKTAFEDGNFDKAVDIAVE
jgi:hypothetical protein